MPGFSRHFLALPPALAGGLQAKHLPSRLQPGFSCHVKRRSPAKAGSRASPNHNHRLKPVAKRNCRLKPGMGRNIASAVKCWQSVFMEMRFSLLMIAFLVISANGSPGASYPSDLGSSLQQTRDTVAKSLRTTYRPPSRARWEAVVASLKAGERKEKVIEQLRAFNPTYELGDGNDRDFDELYRLDDLWVIRLSFHTPANKPDTLSGCELLESMRDVWVEPPPNFTGTWVIYYVNGERSSETHYRDGRRDGEEIGYSPFGRVSRRGYYKKGDQVGTWTWYDKDGSICRTENRDKPSR